MLIAELQDVYFDDESAEVVISSLRLGDDQGRYVYIVEVVLAYLHLHLSMVISMIVCLLKSSCFPRL